MTTVKEIQSVRNACTVVEAVAAHQPVGVSELARITGIDKSAVHRIAVTLHRTGWLRPTSEPSTRWELSPFSRILRQAAMSSLEALARPAMEKLRDATGETVLLVVMTDGRFVVQEAVESRQPVRLSPPPGMTLPFRGSAASRVIAAHLPAEELQPLLAVHPELDDGAIRAARKKGWAGNDREVTEDAVAVAAVLLTKDGYPVGALVVCGPSSRMSSSDLGRFGALAVKAARGVVIDQPDPPR